MYRYFISYAHSKGFGNVILKFDNQISTVGHLVDIAKKIDEQCGVVDVTILTFQLFPEK